MIAMFIRYFLPKNFQKKKKTEKILKKQPEFSKINLLGTPNFKEGKYISALSYIILPAFDQSLYIFKKQRTFKKKYPRPLFYKNNFSLPVTSAINSLIFLNCDKKFQFLLSRLFWNLKVTDHKFILLWLRRVCKYLYTNKKQFNISGLSIFIKGKLGVTGNKRTRTFKVNYGSNSSTKIISNTCSNYFTIRTTTGVIGFTTSITYNH